MIISLETMRKGLFIVFALASLVLYSCGGRMMDRLSDVESYINERPDSALAALRAIDTLDLRTRAEKAKFSLLHAMALDKNYIDTADTRVVMPAVDYYSRHGSPEERLKAYMYLGTEQFNAGRYNEAIVSFNQADEFSNDVDDFNLLGVLYSKIGDTFTNTQDHAQAGAYIDKSLECFRRCGRKDQENLELIQKAGNLTQRRKWAEADSCFTHLLSDETVGKYALNRARIAYALFLLSLPKSDELKAMDLFSQAFNEGASFYESSQIYVYSYLLKRFGRQEDSDALLKRFPPRSNLDKYYYYYWVHRESLSKGNYKEAYKDLRSAFSSRDSLLESVYETSAANAQRSRLEALNETQRINIQSQRRLMVIISLLCVVLALFALLLYLLYQKNKQKSQEERDRMNMVIDSLKSQIIEKGRSDKSKAKFAFLAEVYEEAYRNSGDNEIEGNILRVLRSRIGDLRSNQKARDTFEQMIDKEMNGAMSRFRKDCPGLTEQDYCMASLYFAGFDNTTVMIILGISTLENARTKKRRLKQKIIELYDQVGERYVSLIG